MSTDVTKPMSSEIAPEDTVLDIAHLSPLICVELACGLSDKDSILDKYRITDAQWLRLSNNPTFIAMMKEAESNFAGEANAGKRITKKAEVLLEESLTLLHRIMTRPDASTQAVLDTVKQLTVLAGRTQRQMEGGAGGSGFNVAIHINTGQDDERVVESVVATSKPSLEGEVVEVAGS